MFYTRLFQKLDFLFFVLEALERTEKIILIFLYEKNAFLHLIKIDFVHIVVGSCE